MHFSSKEETCTGTFNVNGRETVALTVWFLDQFGRQLRMLKSEPNMFCQDVFQVLKSLLAYLPWMTEFRGHTSSGQPRLHHWMQPNV